jgi:hypothetical protein
MVAADGAALRRVENMVDGALRRREGRTCRCMHRRITAPSRTFSAAKSVVVPWRS